ncbi:hypothetical protein [Collibacillus ludicampi]|nr:hypothetical protein [Collibacillus ludicampi]
MLPEDVSLVDFVRQHTETSATRIVATVAEVLPKNIPVRQHQEPAPQLRF